MIPFIRSLSELMAISQSRTEVNKCSINNDFQTMTEDSGQRKRYIRSINERKIELPNLPKTSRLKWEKRKEAVFKIFDALDYNNQIQSSYELTLLERQTRYRHEDVA